PDVRALPRHGRPRRSRDQEDDGGAELPRPGVPGAGDHGGDRAGGDGGQRPDACVRRQPQHAQDAGAVRLRATDGRERRTVRRAAVVFAVFFAAQGAVLLAAESAAEAKSKRVKRHKKPKVKPASAASSRADGKEHLKKAKALAAKDACELAIEEFTLAFDRLNDPEILLPRAECRRKVGQDVEAVADYKAYLEFTPDVANKADIEAKIAALEAGPS